jgi:hypothetical protein
MTPEQKEYLLRKAAIDSRYQNKFAERWFSWWRNPSDRFAFLIAVFTAGLFFATVKLWWSTNDLVAESRSAGRAWVAPLNASFAEPFDPQKQIALIKISELNVGKEPALGVVHIALIDTVQADSADSIKDRNVCGQIKAEEGQSTIFPSDRFGATLSYGRDFSKNPEVLPEIMSGKRLLYVMGCTAYVTVEKERKTGYCFYLYPELGPQTGTISAKPVSQWQFRGCPVGNHAD